jgi:hypothetical protein
MAQVITRTTQGASRSPMRVLGDSSSTARRDRLRDMLLAQETPALAHAAYKRWCEATASAHAPRLGKPRAR